MSPPLPPPPGTPPAYVAQLERRQAEQQRELGALRSKVETDSLVMMERLGEIAGWCRAIAAKLGVTP